MDTAKKLGLNGLLKGASSVNDVTSLASLNGKLDIAITKIANLDSNQESIYDKMVELVDGQAKLVTSQNSLVASQTKLVEGQRVLKKSQEEIVDTNKQIVSTLANGMLELKETMRQAEPLSKKVRISLAITGGVAGGVAGGALMILILHLLLASHNPSAQHLLSYLQLLRRRFLQDSEKLFEAIGNHPVAFCFEEGRHQDFGHVRHSAFCPRCRCVFLPQEDAAAQVVVDTEVRVTRYLVLFGYWLNGDNLRGVAHGKICCS